MLLGALALVSAVGLMATSGWLISRASQQPPVLYLMMAVTATRAFGIGRAVFRYAERLVSHDAVLRMLADTRVAVYRRLERLAPAGLRGTRRGDLLTRLVSDVDALQDYWLRWLLLLPYGAAVAVSTLSVGFTAWLLPEAGAVLAAGLLAAGVGVPLLTAAVARRTERRLAPARGDLATRVTDLLTGTAELTVAGALPARAEGTRRADGVLTRIASRSAALTGLGDGLTALISGLTVAAAGLVGVQGVTSGLLDGVALAVVVLTPLAAFEAVLGMPPRRAPPAAGAPQRGARVRGAGRPGARARAGDTRQAPVSPFPLTLKGLTARHPGQDRDAVAGLDLTLERGRRVAVVGPSGSGKTTLAQVMLRFLDPGTGSYTLAGVDARALDGDDVRRLVGLCAQDAHLFNSTVRENLLLARKDATEADLRDALGRARLLEWADGLPDGLDTLVGEHGARLSGGQRQRLALARALLADFPVLVLDEPAEHLDLPTADALTADLLAATEGRTTVLVTHRLAGLEAVDEVIVLDAGRVVQRGRYEELRAVDGALRDMALREEETGPGGGVLTGTRERDRRCRRAVSTRQASGRPVKHPSGGVSSPCVRRERASRPRAGTGSQACVSPAAVLCSPPCCSARSPCSPPGPPTATDPTPPATAPPPSAPKWRGSTRRRRRPPSSTRPDARRRRGSGIWRSGWRSGSTANGSWPPDSARTWGASPAPSTGTAAGCRSPRTCSSPTIPSS